MNNIVKFWKWFSEHRNELAAPNIPDALFWELEEQLFAIHRLDWEIGPGRKAPNLFALSPAGDPELLQLTRWIIAKAPRLPNWEFYAAKPARSWNLTFCLSVHEKPVEIDGKQWEFVALEFPDGTYDIIMKPDQTHDLSEEYLYWAATIILDGELGEEKRMETIKDTEIVLSWEEKFAQAARKLELGLLASVLTD